VPPSLESVTTNTRAMNAVDMIQLACASTDPIKRAQLLAEAQPQLAWALRSAIQECQDADLPWAAIGERIGLPRETVYRQVHAGGPVVTVRAAQVKTSPNLTGRNTPAGEAIYAFQTEDDRWWGPHQALPAGDFTTAMLPFQPANPESNRFADQLLRVRVGACTDDVSFYSAQIRLADGTERRVRITYEVMNLLFENGQTPLRRALTQLVHATVGNPAVGAAFQEIVNRAATAQTHSTTATVEDRIPTTEFIAAVQAVLTAARNTPEQLDTHASMAVRRLELVVADYETWRRATR
jgi:hypothetical protein